MTVSFAEELHAEEVQLEDMAPEFSEEAMALIFADRHASHLRYVSKWGRWKKYDGQRWVDDERLEVYDFARIICREVETPKPIRDVSQGSLPTPRHAPQWSA